MKLYDLKLKEIGVLEKELNKEKARKPKMKALTKEDQLKLKQKKTMVKLAAQKKKVTKVTKEIAAHHNSLVKVVSVYNKDFAKRNKTHLKNLMTALTMQLKAFMKNPHFKEAYKMFMIKFMKIVQTLSPDALKTYDVTAANLIKDHFNKILNDLVKKATADKLKNKFPMSNMKSKHAKRTEAHEKHAAKAKNNEESEI